MSVPVDASTFDLDAYRADLEANAPTDPVKRVSLWFLNLMSHHNRLAQAWRVLKSPPGKCECMFAKESADKSAGPAVYFKAGVVDGVIEIKLIKFSAQSVNEEINVPLQDVETFLDSGDIQGLGVWVIDTVVEVSVVDPNAAPDMSGASDPVAYDKVFVIL